MLAQDVSIKSDEPLILLFLQGLLPYVKLVQDLNSVTVPAFLSRQTPQREIEHNAQARIL